MTLPSVYWLTRDSFEGVLSGEVAIWHIRPEFHGGENGDGTWLTPLHLIDLVEGQIATWSLDQAYRAVRNGIPQTARECLRVGKTGA